MQIFFWITIESRNRSEAIMRVLNYRIFLKKEPEGGYTVIVPSLPGCVTYGETVDEAKAMAREAIELYVETLTNTAENCQHIDTKKCGIIATS